MKNKLALKLIFGVVISVSTMLYTLEASGPAVLALYPQYAKEDMKLGKQYLDTYQYDLAANSYEDAAIHFRQVGMYKEAADAYIAVSNVHEILASEYGRSNIEYAPYSREELKAYETEKARKFLQKAEEMRKKISSNK